MLFDAICDTHVKGSANTRFYESSNPTERYSRPGNATPAVVGSLPQSAGRGHMTSNRGLHAHGPDGSTLTRRNALLLSRLPSISLPTFACPWEVSPWCVNKPTPATASLPRRFSALELHGWALSSVSVRKRARSSGQGGVRRSLGKYTLRTPLFMKEPRIRRSSGREEGERGG